MIVLDVGDAGVAEGEIWYLRLEGILFVLGGDESVPDGEMRQKDLQLANESGLLVPKYAKIVRLFGSL